MSMSMSITPRERTKAMAAGTGLAVVGMSAYYLPVSENRFVRAAFNVVEDEARDTVELLNDSALAISKDKLKPDQKLFLSQLGVAEDITAINAKIADLKNSVTDKNLVKTLKQGFADSFKDCKNSEILRDSTAVKAFKRIRWTNFAWGAGIGFVLGNVLSKLSNSSNPPSQL